MLPRPLYRSSRRLAGLLAAAGFLALSGGWIDSQANRERPGAEAFWRAGVPRPIAVRGGRATFRFPTRGPRTQTLVIVSALARCGGPFPVRLTARSATTAAVPDLADDGRSDHPRPEGSHPLFAAAHPPDEAPPGRIPPRDRTFHLMVREGNPGVAGNYVAVRAVLKGVGRRVQVYAAAEDVGRVERRAIEDIIRTFDDRIYPMACESGALARDVDGDGRLTVLLSSWLDRLGGGKNPVDGFVKVADLDATIPAPFGNRGDIVYLNVTMSAGPYLRTVLAHEYAHAATYTRKTLEPADSDGPGPEEEGWLDEAIAHLAEDAHGFSPSNIDYRISAFLSSPERYSLVVDDYFAANLFRSHGHRGSTYLFLRWCADRYGPDLVPRLVGSPLRGVANVEAATGATFAELFRRWSLALFRSGLDATGSTSGGTDDGYRSIDLYAPWSEGDLAGPRFRRVTPGGPADRWDAAGTSTHFVLVEGDTAGAVEVEVDGLPAAGLQVTAMPIGDDRARLSLAIERHPGPGGWTQVVARLAERDGIPVRLCALSWEPVVPAPRPRDDARRPGRLDMLGIAAAFGTSALPGRGSLRSRPIPLVGIPPGTGPVVVKAIGTDPAGRRVTAWAELDVDSPPTDGR